MIVKQSAFPSGLTRCGAELEKDRERENSILTNEH